MKPVRFGGPDEATKRSNPGAMNLEEFEEFPAVGLLKESFYLMVRGILKVSWNSKDCCRNLKVIAADF